MTIADHTSGVLERCDDCGRQTVCQAVMDPDDPLGWVIEGWTCHPCAVGETEADPVVNES